MHDPNRAGGEYFDIYSHGDQGWTLIEPLSQPGEWVLILSRFEADGTPIILRNQVLDEGVPLTQFNLDIAGDGPSLVQVWRRNGRVQMAFGPMGGCPPAAP